jgi:hypothetical protein
VEEIREQVLEILGMHVLRMVAGALGALGEAAIGRSLGRPFGTGLVDLAAVVARALVGVRQQRVGARDRLEALLGLVVARVEVRVVPLGELAVGLVDLVRTGVRLDPEDLVGRWHVRLTRSVGGCGNATPAATGRGLDLCVPAV